MDIFKKAKGFLKKSRLQRKKPAALKVNHHQE